MITNNSVDVRDGGDPFRVQHRGRLGSVDRRGVSVSHRHHRRQQSGGGHFSARLQVRVCAGTTTTLHHSLGAMTGGSFSLAAGTSVQYRVNCTLANVTPFLGIKRLSIIARNNVTGDVDTSDNTGTQNLNLQFPNANLDLSSAGTPLTHSMPPHARHACTRTQRCVSDAQLHFNSACQTRSVSAGCGPSERDLHSGQQWRRSHGGRLDRQRVHVRCVGRRARVRRRTPHPQLPQYVALHLRCARSFSY
jgi:hypothetical protein